MKKNIIQIASVTLLTLLISLILGISFPLILLSALFIVIFIQLPQSVHSILFARISITILILVSLFQLESVIFWVSNVEVIPLVYVLVTLAITLIWVVHRTRKGINIRGSFNSLKPSRTDLIILIPAVILSGLMLTRAIIPKEDNMASIVKSIAYGMDDATHVRLLGDVFRTGSNLTALRGEKYGNTVSSAGAYPLGWHLSTSIVTSSLVNTQHIDSRDLVLIYFIAKMLSFFGAIASLSFFLVVLAEKMKLKTNNLLGIFTFAGLGLGISFLLILPLYFDGFFSFFPIVIYTMTFAALYIQKTGRKSRPYVELILLLLTIASAFTWLLTAPILLIALAFRYYQQFGSLKKIPLKYYAVLLVAAVSIVIQVISFLYDNIQVSSLSLNGGIKSPGPFLLIAILAIYAFFYIKEKDYFELRSKISLLVIPSLLFLAALLLFISLSSSTITYYFYKIQVVILILLMPIVGVYLVALVQRSLQSTKEKFSGIVLLGLIVILSIPSIIGYDYISHIVTRVQHTLISGQVAGQIVSTDLNETFSTNNPVVYYLYPSTPAQAILASNIARMNYPETECSGRMFDATYSGDIEHLVQLAIRCSPTTPTIQIYTDQDSYNKLNKIIPSTYLTTKEIVIKTL